VSEDPDTDRSDLLERLARLERAVARSEKALDAYAGAFAKLRDELEEMRGLVAAEEGELPSEPAAPATVAPTPPPVERPVGPRTTFAPTTPTAAPPPPGPPPPPPGPPPPGPPHPPPPSRPAAPPKAPRRTLGQLARDWDLVGARGFAIAGGAVMALGIGFFFVLAANRGWIDEQTRVALGATASALVFGVGLLLRARYGQYWSALAAVGAGIAGAYATLAAATARYDLVPDALALPLAGAIAAVGTVVAVRWSSQVIAAIGLLGAALAPALQSIDTEITWESAAFAVIVLVAAAALCVPRAWVRLLYALSLVVGLQVEWLVLEAPASPSGGTVAVAAALALTLLGVSAGRRLVRRTLDLDALALGYASAAFGVALTFSFQLFEAGTDRGTALLAAGAVWALVFAALQIGRIADLALVVGVGALALAAVGTADLLAGATLTVVWAAQSLALTVVAWRLGDARLRLTGIAYAVVAAAQALGSDAVPGILFDATGDQAGAVLPLASVALAFAAAGLLVPDPCAPRTESGLLAFVREIRLGLVRHRSGIAEALGFTAAAFGTLAAAFALTAASFQSGHVTASGLAAAVGAVLLGVAGRRQSLRLAVASYAWLAVVLVEAFAFDIDELYDDETLLSAGGWSVAAAAAGLLGGAYAHRILHPGRRGADVLLGIVAGVSAVSVSIAIGVLTDTERGAGGGFLLAAVAYGALAAGVFSRDGFRNASTILWSFGLVFLVSAEAALVTNDVGRTIVIALTGLAAGAAARPLAEMRLWLAGGALALLTTIVALLVQVEPWLAEGELERILALVSAACALSLFGLSWLVWGQERWRDLSTVLWAAGLAALLATERVLVDDLRGTAVAVALTGGALALASDPLRESRLWTAGAVVVSAVLVVTVAVWTPPSHLLVASEAPADALWVLLAGLAGLGAVALSARDSRTRTALEVVAGGIAVYALSLGILEIAERVSMDSVETDFERGQTAVSGFWALIGLSLLVVGLLRGSPGIRYAGLALFGLSLAKIFLYDLSSLSSVARAFSFILVGGLLLAGGFFLQRLSDRLGPPKPPRAPSEAA
jgi:uncharacterized membrane protein